MTRCSCVQDPDEDGCYRCLFAYRNSREMAETSRKAAVDLFARILEHRDKLEPIAALSDISVDGLMDSVLEARFIEALRRMDRPGRPVRVAKFPVHRKAGYQVHVGEQGWNVEPQLKLGKAQAICPTVEIDFVFHPLSGDARPLAVFLDGFTWHRDRIGKDLLQRMTLASSGRFDVWSLTWWDVDVVFHAGVEAAPSLVHPAPAGFAQAAGRLGLGSHADVLGRSLMELLVDVLGGGGGDRGKLARLVLFTQMKAPGAVDRGAWLEEVRQRAPSVAWPGFEDVGPEHVIAWRPPTAELPFGLWAAAPLQAIHDTDGERFVCLLWLDDRSERWTDSAFRDQWRGLLHAVQHLLPLPHAWFVSEHGRAGLDFTSLALLREPVEQAADGWDELDVEPEFTAVVEALRRQGLHLPEVGLDLLDARGHTTGLVGELVWDEARVAVVEDRSEAERPVDPGWRVFEVCELAADASSLVDVLRSRPRGES